ncbi:hypothetical protein LCGC14_2649370 [marine sediment metagenome]|uniref:Uncharacterized protein n=1 Tax=marine sediment metagenome TaxID=412755 RepID=A0A0F9CM87_9ZZZZ
MTKTSKYYGVSFSSKADWGEEGWFASMKLPKFFHKWIKVCKTEREAAIAVDLKLIESGMEPKNILKSKLKR